jgi:hypothetical protein
MRTNAVPEQGTVRLCGVQGCCPAIDFNDPKSVVLTDDFNGKVTLTREQWADLKAKFGDQPAAQGK